MAITANVNGRIVDKDHAVISVFDHGFLYGEGIYETLRTYNGQPFLFDRHMKRLRHSAQLLSLPVPLTDDEMAERSRDTMQAAGLGEPGYEAYIRILVTRGIGELSYDPSACPQPSIVVITKPQVDPPADAYERGVKTAIVSTVRNHPGTVSPIIKSNNLLNNALAMQEAFRRGAYEGIMRNYRGELAECTQSNLFIVSHGRVLTPPLESGLLLGITREFVLEVAAQREIPAGEEVLHDTDLFEADEAFLTSTTREVVPIVSVDEQRIGLGTPGPITLTLLAAFRERAQLLTSRSASVR